MRNLVAVEDNTPKKDNVLRVEWNLGRRCNYDCSYCCPSIHDKKSEHLAIETIEKTVIKISEQARKTGKRTRISLTGGEPYLHPQFMEILKLIKANGIQRISVTSNGSLLAKTYIESMQFIDYLIISFHFEFGNSEKFLSKVKEIFDNLEKNRDIHIHIMAIPSKVDEALYMAEELKNMGIPYILRRVRPQFNKGGLFVPPFASGLSGGHKANQKLISEQNLQYYSIEEVRKLESF